MQINLQPEGLTAANANLAADPGSLAYRLFSEDKFAQLAAIGLPHAQADMLIQMQWRGRNLTYARQYPGAEDWTISLDDGVPIGRYSLHKTQQGFRLVDFALLPGYRGRGIGTQVMQQLGEKIAAAGGAFSLHVEKNNPALRLYSRMGFTVTGEDELSYEMILQHS